MIRRRFLSVALVPIIGSSAAFAQKPVPPRLGAGSHQVVSRTYELDVSTTGLVDLVEIGNPGIVITQIRVRVDREDQFFAPVSLIFRIEGHTTTVQYESIVAEAPNMYFSSPQFCYEPQFETDPNTGVRLNPAVVHSLPQQHGWLRVDITQAAPGHQVLVEVESYDL